MRPICRRVPNDSDDKVLTSLKRLFFTLLQFKVPAFVCICISKFDQIGLIFQNPADPFTLDDFNRSQSVVCWV